MRELANVIERAVVLGQGAKLTIHELPSRIGASERTISFDNLSYRGALSALRRELVVRALAQARGHRAAAAKALGLHEKYFLRLIKSLRIE